MSMQLYLRSDRGLENVGVADFMLAARQGDLRAPFVTGHSVHNQRVERLWMDLFHSCLEPFHTTFW